MTAIFTKQLSVTNTKPNRISVRPANGGKGMIISKSKLENQLEDIYKNPNDFDITNFPSFNRINENEKIHYLAARILCEAKRWTHGELVIGGTKEGYVFVFENI